MSMIYNITSNEKEKNSSRKKTKKHAKKPTALLIPQEEIKCILK